MIESAPQFRSFQAMGTRFECLLAGFDREWLHPDAAALAESIEAIVLDEHHRLSVFESQSVLSRLNRTAAQQPVQIDPALFELLSRCIEYARETDGAFDITAGSLMEVFGFRGEHDHKPAVCGSHLVHLDPAACSVRFAASGIRLDLGGVAKGYVLDVARDELIGQGTTNALIHGGTSSAVAIGPAPDGSPWRVRLFADDARCPTVDLTDRALACSSPTGRLNGSSGHIMDTRASRPATSVEAACVVGPSAEICEAWSTALVVAPDLANRLPSAYEAHILRSHQWLSFTQSSRSSPPIHLEAYQYV